MSKFKKWLGKTAVAATVGVVSLQASASAAPLDDLNAILEKQAQAEAPSPISTMLDWDNIVKAMNEGGAQVSINATIPEELLADAELPEQLQGDLGLTADTTIDLKDKQWLFKLAAAVNADNIASLSLYGDENQLALTLPEFLSKTVALKSGSFKEQYEGSVWEQFFGELDMPEDIDMKFFPEGTASAEDTTDLLGNIKAILEKATTSAQDAMNVETREDAEYPGVTFYDATYDTESVMSIYSDLLTELSSVLSASGVTGVEDFDAAMEESLEQGKAVLGDQFTITYWVENDLVTKMTMTMKMDESLIDEQNDTLSDLDNDAESETEEVTTAAEASESSVMIMDLVYTFTDPANMSAGFDMDMDIYEEGAEEDAMHLAYAFANEITDSKMDVKVNLKASDSEETFIDADIFTMNFDAESGALDMKISIPDEETGTDVGMNLNSAFEDVQEGKGFTWTLNNLTLAADGEELPLLTGYVTVNADYEKIETPADAEMLADMDSAGVMGLVMELQSNAESWMEKWGLAEEETETDEDGITTLPETDEEIPVVDDLETETEA